MRVSIIKKIVLYGLVAGVIAVLTLFFFAKNEEELSYTTVSEVSEKPSFTSNNLFKIEVVSTKETREQGLSGRKNIPENYGMLFIFPTPDIYGFWMKDMKVPIDIIWLSDTGSILKIEESVSPKTYPNVFYPPEPVRYVLETSAGESVRKRWEVGQTLLSVLSSADSVCE